MLAARGLAWRVGERPILGPLDLDIEAGECLVVVGPNGAGKTTLLRLLTGVLEPTEGRLWWEGVSFDRLSRRQRARRLAYVPQARPLHVPLTVGQLVLLGRYPHLGLLGGAPGEADFAAVDRALERVGLAAIEDRRLVELSGGERQAAYIAAALAQEAELLVLDEPTTHLDPRHQRQVASLVRRLHHEEGKTLVLATHDLHLAAHLADRVLALRGGVPVFYGPPAEVLEPGILGELFDAPFTRVAVGDLSLSLLELDS